jgi:hypothetical protein
MPFKRCLPLAVILLLAGFGLAAPALAQTPTQAPAPAPGAPPKGKCGPDHAILYKRAVTLLDKAEKKLTTGYTAEAKALAKEAKSLLAIVQKECGQEQRERVLTDKEAQQEAINQKLAADEQAQAERLEKSAAEKFKKAQPLEDKQPELYQKWMRESKEEAEAAHKRNIRAMIYALRNQQMVFSFLGK